MADSTFEVDVKARVEGQKEVDELGQSIEGLGKKSAGAAKGSREITKTLREAKEASKGTSDSIKEASAKLEEYKKVTQQHVFFSKEARDAQEKLRAEVQKAQQKFEAAKASTAQAAAALATYKASANASAGTVARLENSLSKATRQLDAQRASLSSLKTETAAHTGGVQSAISGMKNWAAGAGATTLAIGGLAMGISAAGSAIREASDQSIKYRAATQALKFGIDAAKESTLGLVNSYDLTLAANRAAQTGVATTEEQFAKLTGAATRLGLAMGRDAKESVNDLIGALATNSTEVLDNLGITLRVGQAQELYAEKLGKTTKELTDQEKAQAFAIMGAEKALEAADALNLSFSDSELVIGQVAAKWDDFAMKTQEYATLIAGGLVIAMERLVDVSMEAVASLSDINGVMDTQSMKAAAIGLQIQKDANTRIEQLQSMAAQLHSLGLTMKDIGDIDFSDLDKAQKKVDALQASMMEEQPALGPSKEEWEAANREAKEKAKRAKEVARKKKEQDRKRAQEEAKAAKEYEARGTFKEDPNAIQDYLDERYAMLVADAERERKLAEVRLSEAKEGTFEHIILIDQEAEAHLRLIEIKKEATNDAIELAALETEALAVEEERRIAKKKSIAEAQKKLDAEEAKRQEKRTAIYGKVSTEVGQSLSAIASAHRSSGDSIADAMKKELAAVARNYQQKLTIYAIEQGVLAIASAARYDFGAAGLHAAAAAAAGVGAIALAGIAGGLEAETKPATEREGASKEASPSAASSSQKASSGPGKEASTPTGQEFPASRDPLTKGVKNVPQRNLEVTVILEKPTFFTDQEDAMKWINRAVRRAEGKV